MILADQARSSPETDLDGLEEKRGRESHKVCVYTRHELKMPLKLNKASSFGGFDV